MKKIILLLLVSSFGFAQGIGKTKITVDKTEKNYNPKTDNELWVEFTTSYMMTFNQNSIGIKHAFEKVKGILLENNLDFNKPLVNNNYLSTAVRNLDDYELLNITVKDGSSEVRMIWEINGKIIAISLSDKNYFITISK